MKKWKCKLCGYIHDGDSPPDKCPLCGAGKDMFEEVGGEKTVQSEQDEQKKGVFSVVRLIRDHHLHPISVHTPNGVLPMALVFIVMGLMLCSSLFAAASLYSLVFVLLIMPVVFFTGIVEWKGRYKGVMSGVFKIKIAASICVTVLLVILVVWGFVEPGIITSWSGKSLVYLVLAIIMVGAAGLAGHIGGKLVFDSRNN